MPTTAPRPTKQTAASKSVTPESLAEIVKFLNDVPADQVVVLDDRFTEADGKKNGPRGIAISRATLNLKAIEKAYGAYNGFLRAHAIEVEPGTWAPALSVRSTVRPVRQRKAKTEDAEPVKAEAPKKAAKK